MKNLLLVVALSVMLPWLASAYQNQGGKPGTVHDATFKPVIKSAVSGVSDAIASGGEVLSYSAANDGYTVTRVGAGAADRPGSALIACVSKEAIATGDTAAHLCQVKGYALVKWDASALEWARGERLCANSVGAAVNCNVAGSTSGVIALEAHARGESGAAMPVLLELR